MDTKSKRTSGPPPGLKAQGKALEVKNLLIVYIGIRVKLGIQS